MRQHTVRYNTLHQLGRDAGERNWSVITTTPSTWNFGSTGPLGAKLPILNRYSLVVLQS